MEVLKLLILELIKSKELCLCLPGAVLVKEVSNLNQTHCTSSFENGLSL